MRSSFFRSLGVSLVTVTLEIILFTLSTLVLAGKALLLARWICGGTGAVCNFLLNRAWAFDSGRRGSWTQHWRYAVTAISAVSLGTALWWLLVFITSLGPRWMHLLSMATVWLSFTFPMMRCWVFRREQRPGAGLVSLCP